MSSLSVRIGDQRPFGMDIEHRQGLRVLRGLSVLLGLLVVGSVCEAGQDSTSGPPAVVAADDASASVRQEESRMLMTVGERRFAITLTDNAAARAFAAQLPLTLDMSELNGNEKHAELPKSIARECEPTRNDPQWRSYVVRLNHLGGFLSDIRLVVLVHPPRRRGRPHWLGSGARPARREGRVFEGLLVFSRLLK
jgi:hypothetical protein